MDAVVVVEAGLGLRREDEAVRWDDEGFEIIGSGSDLCIGDVRADARPPDGVLAEQADAGGDDARVVGEINAHVEVGAVVDAEGGGVGRGDGEVFGGQAEQLDGGEVPVVDRVGRSAQGGGGFKGGGGDGDSDEAGGDWRCGGGGRRDLGRCRDRRRIQLRRWGRRGGDTS